MAKASIISITALVIGLYSQYVAASYDYAVLPNPKPLSDGRIEVRQFFSYQCWGCYQQAISLQPLVKLLPKDVVFTRTALPLKKGDFGESGIRVFYALEHMGATDVVHLDLLKESGVKGVSALKPQNIRAVMAKHHVSVNRFNTAYASPHVGHKIAAARTASQDFGITKVPAIVVNGTYLVNSNSERMNATILHLISKERAKKLKKK